MNEASNGAPIVVLEAIERRFGRAGHTFVEALRGIDLQLDAGEFVAIRGASGSGKSTLLQIVGLLDRATSGRYCFAGRDVTSYSDRERTQLRNESIGFVFQSFHLLNDRSALANVELPLEYRRSDVEPRDSRELLTRFGLGDRCAHRPGELSGGEKQRVAIARALVKRPHLILLDEPTGNLDSQTGSEILDLLGELHERDGITMLMVTHDAAVAKRADRELMMKDGHWVV